MRAISWLLAILFGAPHLPVLTPPLESPVPLRADLIGLHMDDVRNRCSAMR